MFISSRNILIKQKGSLFIELMFAMTLSLLLITFLLEIYFAAQKSYRLQMALNRIQEHAKTAIHILKSDIQAAGYIGCARLDEQWIIKPYLNYSLSVHNQLQGTNAEIIVRHAAATSVMLQKSAQQTDVLYVSKETNFAPRDILIITDCKQGEIFQVKKIRLLREWQIIIADHPLQNQYDSSAQVSLLEENKYFVAQTQRKHGDGSRIHALYREDIKHRRTELVEEVESMTIHYEEMIGHISHGAVMITLWLATPPIKKIWYLYAGLIQEKRYA